MPRSPRRAAGQGHRTGSPLGCILGFHAARDAWRAALSPHHDHGPLAGLLHHLFFAWAITAAVFLATIAGYTSFIDTVFLAMVQGFEPAPDGGVDQHPGTPVLIKLEPRDYHDRAAFARSLQAVIDDKPRLIAIDIDLSPEPTLPAAGQAELDRVMDAAAAKLPIVIVQPMGKRNDVDAPWIRARCKAGVQVASPHLYAQFGLLMRFQPDMPSLGAVVAHKMMPTMKAVDEHAEPEAGPPNLCPSGDSQADTRDIGALYEHSGSQVWQGIDLAFKLTWIPGAKEISTPDSRVKIRGHAVFFAGEEELRTTSRGRMQGAELHARIAATRQHALPHLWGYLLEIIIGVTSGVAFHALWRRVDEAHGQYRRHLLGGSGTRHWVPPLALMAGTGLGILVIGVLVMVAAVALSVELYSHGRSLNPAPLIIGMAVDSFLSHQRAHQNVPAARSRSWWRPLFFHPSSWLGLVLIVCSLYYLIRESVE